MGDSIRELYFGYLVFFLFIGFKLYISVKEFRKMLGPIHHMMQPPQFGDRETKQVSCDLSQKVVTAPVVTLTNRHGTTSYCEDDLLHWMASYGTCPETGVIHCMLAYGDGRTRMAINLF